MTTTPAYIEQDCGYDTPCWEWQHRKNRKNGYGKTTHKGKPNQYAHRAYYEDRYGSIPDGMCLDHLCGNPACVNPSHLEPVTQAENVRRGRSTKVTPDKVRLIRHLARIGYSQPLIGRVFGLAPSSVSNIVCRYKWADIDDGGWR